MQRCQGKSVQMQTTQDSQKKKVHLKLETKLSSGYHLRVNNNKNNNT